MYYFPISFSMHTPPHKCVQSCKNSKQHNCLKTVMVLTFPTTKKGTSEICINDSGPSFECDVCCRTQELTTSIVHQKVKTPMHFHCVSDKLLHLLVAVIAKIQKALLNTLTANIKLSHALAIYKAQEILYDRDKLYIICSLLSLTNSHLFTSEKYVAQCEFYP